LSIQLGKVGRAPVFCIPGAGDNVLPFTALADALGDEWPIHALQPRGLDVAVVPHSSVEAAAAAYLASISEVVSHGPLHLIGHSFGGWVAFEIAQQLLGRAPGDVAHAH